MPQITADPWAEVDQRVLDALHPTVPRTAGELRLGMPDSEVRATLKNLARTGRARVHHNAVRTAYTKAV